MLPSLSRKLRLALVLTISAAYAGWHGHGQVAFAKGSDDGGDDDDSGDTSDGGDKPDGADNGDSDSNDEESENPEDDKKQPPVTAGGLFTLKTYPIRENERPLTITHDILQLRLSVGTDLSALGAFDTAGVNLEAEYGVKDNFMLIGGLTDAYNMRQFSAYFGFEGALAYDLLDVRVAANLHRTAIPEFCDSAPASVTLPSTCTDPTSGEILPLPDGTYHAGGTQFSIDLGFPFRYAFKPQIAIIALQTLMSIDFNSAKNSYYTVVPELDSMGDPVTDSQGNDINQVKKFTNTAKPDLKPSIGIQVNPIPELSIVLTAQLIVPDFNTSLGSLQIPVTGRVEYSPSRQLDIGLEFTLLNVDPPDPQGPIDNRFLSLFAQYRIGK
jgi:hypothetical protein